MNGMVRSGVLATVLAAFVAAMVACGGGLGHDDTDGAVPGEVAGHVAALAAEARARRARPVQASFYGDSLTAGRALAIAGGAFVAADHAVWGLGSYAPLAPTDVAPVAVIRYGMADAIREMTPEQTLANVLSLAAQVRAQGRVALIVGMPCLDGPLGAGHAAALAAVQDVDVTPGCGPVPRTVDGIHPTPAEHARMDTIIRAAVVAALARAAL